MSQENRTLIEDHSWEALANLIPAQGRDFMVEFEPDGENYGGTMKITYMTDIGAAFVPFIEKNINNEIKNMLAGMMKGKDRETFEKLADTHFVRVTVIDGRNTKPVEEPPLQIQEPMSLDAIKKSITEQLGTLAPLLNKKITVSRPEEKPVEKKITETELKTAIAALPPEEEQVAEKDLITQNSETGDHEFDFELEHWSNFFRAYMPHPNLMMFEAWTSKLIVIEINHRLVNDKMTVFKMPESFDKEWLETVRVVNTDPVVADYSWLIRPSKLRVVVDALYGSLKTLAANQKMYNGTVRVNIVKHDDGNVTVSLAYLTKATGETK